MFFYLGLSIAVIILSALVIRQDERAWQREIEALVRAHKTQAEKDWITWGKAVGQLIEASAPPEEREWRLKQFYRDNPGPWKTE